MVQQPARGPKRRKLEGDHTDVLTGVKDDTVDEDVLVRRLTDYVERVDTDMVRVCAACDLCWGILGMALQCVIPAGQSIAVHAERLVTMMQALEYQMQQGLADTARQDLYIMPMGAQHKFELPLHATTCILRLLHSRNGAVNLNPAGSDHLLDS